MRRLFDSLFLKRLEWWAETHQLLSPTQYGFRKGKSTRDCIATLTVFIKNAFKHQKVVVTGFLDISNAYGDVHVAGTVRNLDTVGLPVNYNELIWNLMKQK